MKRSDDALATLVLTNRLTQDAVRPLTPAEYWRAIKVAGGSPSALLEDSSLEDGQLARIQELREAGVSLALDLESLANQGIHALTPFDDEYPTAFTTRLDTAAPPFIFVAGDRGNLQNPGLGIVGSRDIPDDAIPIVKAASEMASRRNIPVVSGGARGVDQLAMATAFQHEGTVVGVLADSLSKRTRDSDTRRAILDGTVTLLTQQNPDMGFTVAGAMSRNKLIYALSQVTFVVATDLDSGGTWAGATEAIKRGYGTVAVWAGAGSGAGNKELIRRGGHSILELDALFELGTVAPPSASPTVDASQLELGL